MKVMRSILMGCSGQIKTLRVYSELSRVKLFGANLSSSS